MSGPQVITFGCRLNAYESEVMRAMATSAGARNAIILNTCAVTAEATRQARQAIRRARKDNPSARIVVTGCAAQIDPECFAAMPEVDLVLGNAEKLVAESYLPGVAGVKVNDIMPVRVTALHAIDGFVERTRAFVEVQKGCDHRCTFCIIPFARGPSRSVPAAAVVEQVRRLAANGILEVVLTGVDITAYGAELPGAPTLGGLVRQILNGVPELRRLRLSSIDTIEADAELLEAIAEEERLMPHLHLSLQSGDDLILKRMKRRHSRAQAVAFCDEIRRRRPDAVFGADLIAGFPTETDAMAENSDKLIGDCGLTFVHVFPFSPRPGTPAARMPQLPRDIVRARAARLREAGAKALGRFLDGEIGATRDVLVEGNGLGRTPQYAAVRFAADATPGTLREASIVGRGRDHLSGLFVS